MKIIDIVNAPWALEPRAHQQLVQIYCAYIRGEKIDLQAIEAQLGRPLQNEEQEGYQVVDGVAVIAVHGVIAKRMNLFSKISGGASTELIARDLRAARADPRVHAIVLDIDSKGGTVDGTQTLADQVYGTRGEKPIVAFVDEASSGAYWIGSAAEEMYISGETVITGSIGVAAQHIEYSKMDEKAGVKVTDIYAGKYKRIASENQPLSEEGRAFLQAIVDQIYTVFVDAVARNRATESSAVLEKMAEGRLFVGRAAINAGLVDGVSTFDALIDDLKAGRKPASAARASAAGR